MDHGWYRDPIDVSTTLLSLCYFPNSLSIYFRPTRTYCFLTPDPALWFPDRCVFVWSPMAGLRASWRLCSAVIHTPTNVFALSASYSIRTSPNHEASPPPGLPAAPRCWCPVLLPPGSIRRRRLLIPQLWTPPGTATFLLFLGTTCPHPPLSRATAPCFFLCRCFR